METSTVICPNRDQVLPDVTEGTMVTVKYDIVNDGLTPVMIHKVSTSCGCTVGKFATTPIQPNETSVVELNFNSMHRKGINEKSAMVTGTFQPSIALTFKVGVV